MKSVLQGSAHAPSAALLHGVQMSHGFPTDSLSQTCPQPSIVPVLPPALGSASMRALGSWEIKLPFPPYTRWRLLHLPRPLSPAHVGQPLTAPSAPSPGVPPGPPSSLLAGMAHAGHGLWGPLPLRGTLMHHKNSVQAGVCKGTNQQGEPPTPQLSLEACSCLFRFSPPLPPGNTCTPPISSWGYLR